MLAAMAVGMLVLGTVRQVSGLAVALESSSAISCSLMAVDMSIGMAAWMRYRKHSWGD